MHFLNIFSGAGNQKQTVYAGVSQLQQQFSNRSNQGAQQTGVMPNYGGGAEKCARCSKSVYLAEKKVGAGRVCITKIHDQLLSFCLLLVLSFELF